MKYLLSFLILINATYATYFCLYKQKIITAEKVIECFDGKWEVNTFVNDGITMTDKYGNSKFYSVKEVDEKIDRLNKLLSKKR